jgi:hypothetical protein
VHPIVWFSSRLHEILDQVSDATARSMSAEEQRSSLLDVTRAQARLAELKLRVLAAGDRADIAADPQRPPRAPGSPSTRGPPVRRVMRTSFSRPSWTAPSAPPVRHSRQDT